jgi:formate hydrogenlyase subunit 3/multisubunit Na+/H+ antiporter MnhD subunit
MSLTLFYPLLKLDMLSVSVSLGCLFFFLIIGFYSFKFLKGKVNLASYFTFYILTAIISCLTVLANNLILLLICWGFLGFTLYMLINMSGTEGSAAAAKKTLLIVGASDSVMLFGMAIIFYLTGTFQMDRIQIPLGSVRWVFPVIAYSCLAIASFAKAGVMPMHSWIPDCSSHAPVPVSAYLPASLDKLLGIYLLARISLDMFLMSEAMNIALMIIGAFTIIAAVMMALVQHDLKRFLGYSTVSQVGYMVLGIGTGTPLGIAGGLFHMFNHALYKSCLFLTSGNVEYRTKTTELDSLGGLSKFMPLTYTAALIASLSISGVPPFNGFFSKWLIYQGLIEGFARYRFIAVGCLTLAMFGSALTLASFLKVLHATYLGQPGEKILQGKPKEVPWPLWLPVIVLSLLCIIFGIFAFQLPLRYIIYPAAGLSAGGASFSFGVPAVLIITAIIAGLILYYLISLKKALRPDNAFFGGEKLPAESRVTGTEFYNSIKELKVLRFMYKKAEAGKLDIYEQGKTAVFAVGKFFQYLHNGVLPTYLVWTLIGMTILFFILVK